MCSDHFSPVERTAGPVRVRLVLARRGAAGDRPAVRRGQRARASATTRRSSRRRSAPWARCTPAGSGPRSAPARPATSTSPATGWPRKDVRTARLRECVDVIRALLRGEEVSHDGLVTVDRARLWTRAGRAAAADRRGRERGDRPLVRGVGRRADHRQRAARPAARDHGRLPRRRRPGQAAPAGAPELGRRRGRAARRSRTSSGAATCSARRCAGTSNCAEHFDVVAEHVTPEQVAEVVNVSADLERHTETAARRTPSSASTRSTCTTSARSRIPFIDAFGEHVLPGGDHDADPARPTSGGRTPSSTASTSRPSRLRRRRHGDFRGLTEHIDHLARGSASPACG